MPAFSTRRCAKPTALACFLSAAIAGCAAPEISPDDGAVAAPRPKAHVPRPIDPGDEGQSRNLLQHYIADNPRRKIADQGKVLERTYVAEGPELEREAWRWELPTKSKRMVVALLMTAARDGLDDLPIVLHESATWGLPDARRPNARPVFGDDNGAKFLAAFRKAAQRFPREAKYTNATNFLDGVQNYLREGAEPMWSYYEVGHDRLFFRMQVHQRRAWIDYVGFFDEAPEEKPTFDALGPAPALSPPIRKSDGSSVHNLNPRQLGARGRPGRGRSPG